MSLKQIILYVYDYIRLPHVRVERREFGCPIRKTGIYATRFEKLYYPVVSFDQGLDIHPWHVFYLVATSWLWLTGICVLGLALLSEFTA